MKTTITESKIDQFTPDPNNANLGTERGTGMIEQSIREYGLGRSVLADKNGVFIAGNKTAEGAVSVGFEDAIVVKTDGTKLVIVQRTDLDLSKDSKAKALAVADNRTGEVNLAWDANVIEMIKDSGADLSRMFHDQEIERLMRQSQDSFTPRSTPEIASMNVSDKDIAQTKAALENRYSRTKDTPDMLEVVCPHCAQEFLLRRSDVLKGDGG